MVPAIAYLPQSGWTACGAPFAVVTELPLIGAVLIISLMLCGAALCFLADRAGRRVLGAPTAWWDTHPAAPERAAAARLTRAAPHLPLRGRFEVEGAAPSAPCSPQPTLRRPRPPAPTARRPPGAEPARSGAVSSDNRIRCWPAASKLLGSSQRSNARSSAGHSRSMAANQAVSRLRPLYTVACRKTPSYEKPSRSAAARDGALSASHFHS